jgi:hypothetical protein
MIEEAKKRARSESWSIISLFQPLPGLFAELGQKKRGQNVLGLDAEGDYICRFLPFPSLFFSSLSGFLSSYRFP